MVKIKDFFFSYLGIIISITANLLLLPVYVRYFGNDDYGGLIIISTLIQYLGLVNFGLPTALTILATNLDDKSLIKPLFYRCLKIIVTILILVAILVLVAVRLNMFSPGFFFGFSERRIVYFNALVIASILYFIRAPSQLSACVFLSIGKIYVNRIYDIINSLCFPLAFLATYIFKWSIVECVWVSGLFMTITYIVSFVHVYLLFPKSEAGITPYTGNAKIASYRHILKLSLSYFLMGIGAALVWNTDNIIIVHFLPIALVTSYSIVFKIYTTCFMIFTSINGILLSYYGSYNGKRQFKRMSGLFKSAAFLTPFIASVIWIIIFLFGHEIISFWTHNRVPYPGKGVFIVLGCYGVVLSVVSTIVTFYSAIKVIKMLLVLTLIEGFVNLIASVLLVSKFQLVGVALGTLLGACVSLVYILITIKGYIHSYFEFDRTPVIKNLLFYGVYFLCMTPIINFSFLQKIVITPFIFLLFGFISMRLNNLDLVYVKKAVRYFRN